MARRIAFTDQAKTDLRSIDQPAAIRILKTLARFISCGEGDVKRLQGSDPPLYRLRVQNHRVLFRDLGELVEVTRVRHRKDAYR
jgi:mRNA-degrading endonuclease RelE of RelBE toxin-antitoxin system